LVVAFDAEVQHPDLEADTAMLERVRTELASSRSVAGVDAEEGL
jgi:hypothetical protein